MVSTDPMSPNPSTSSTMKTLGNTKQDSDDLEWDIQIEYSSDLLYTPNIIAVTKKLPEYRLTLHWGLTVEYIYAITEITEKQTTPLRLY